MFSSSLPALERKIVRLIEKKKEEEDLIHFSDTNK